MRRYKKLILEAFGFKKWLYLTAFIIIFIPTCIVIVSDTSFNPNFSKITISVSIILIIIGKTLTALSNSKKDINFYGDIGVIIGLLLALLVYIF